MYLRETVVCFCWVKCLQMPVRSYCLNLIYLLPSCSITESVELKSPIITVELSISPFGSVSFSSCILRLC